MVKLLTKITMLLLCVLVLSACQKKIEKSSDSPENSVINGVVLLEGENDHSGVSLHIHDFYDDYLTTTDSSGHYSVAVALGEYTVEAAKTGFNSDSVTVRVNTGNITVNAYPIYLNRITAPPVPDLGEQ